MTKLTYIPVKKKKMSSKEFIALANRVAKYLIEEDEYLRRQNTLYGTHKEPRITFAP